MRAKIFALLLFASLITFSCSKDDNATSSNTSDCQTDQSKRRGARCKDGSESSATGSGACSGHGGVDYWL